MKGKLYLIPTTLGETDVTQVIPTYTAVIINIIDEFIVEEEKTARRYLKKLGIKKPLNEIVLHILNEHSKPEDYTTYLDSIEKGKSIGVISEAGCPGIADPGAEIVKLAHYKNIQVIPLSGPSSILMALMASGFSGQSFCFHGYLPKERNERITKIKELEKNAIQKKQSQIFMETPYRNQNLLEDLLNVCNNDSHLCIACEITSPNEFISTKRISQWKNNVPNLHKRPCIFIIG